MAENGNLPNDNGNVNEKPAATMAEVKKIYGDYEVLKPIGKGKFAVVYRAQRMTDGLVVALKRISVDQIDAKAREKCLKEVRLLQSLEHPNIVRYLDSFISDNDLVIVVEWAAAGDLKRQLRKAQERGVGFEERIIWKYFAQIADAMKHMHERRIMHRDLKPANIFLTLDGTVKVGDLGLSRELSEHTVQAHSKVGTPLYMSPEVLRGDGYDFKSDVWSLGCILYELAMLKSPFKAEGLNLYGLFQKISAGDFQPIPENYSDELRSLVYACMSAKAEDRPEISAVCVTATAQREKFAKLRASRSNSAGGNSTSTSNSNTDTALPEGQGPVPPPQQMIARTGSGERNRNSSRPTSTTSHHFHDHEHEGEGMESAEPKEPPSRTNSGRKSARSIATPPVNVAHGAAAANANFLSDYKFHDSGQGQSQGGLEDKDSVVRIPSANSVSGTGRPDSIGGSRQGQGQGQGQGQIPTITDNQNSNHSHDYTNNNNHYSSNAYAQHGIRDDDDDDGSASSSVLMPAAVQPAPVLRAGGFSRPDSASRSRRVPVAGAGAGIKIYGTHRSGAGSVGADGDGDGDAGNTLVGSEHGGAAGGKFEDRSSSQQGRRGNDFNNNNLRPSSRGMDSGLNGTRLQERVGREVRIDSSVSRQTGEPDWAPSSTTVPVSSVSKRRQMKVHNSPNNNDATAEFMGRNRGASREPIDDFAKTDTLPGFDVSGDDREQVRSAGVPTRSIRGTSAGGSSSGGPVDPAKYAQMNATAELMDLLYVKLTILDYPFRTRGDTSGVNGARRVLTPFHFMCDLSIMGGRDNIDSTQQFRRFVRLVVWLCTELGQESLLARWDLDVDSPMLLAKQVLLVSQASGVPTTVLSPDNMPPSSLLPGYGEKVCLLLSALADCLLARRNYKFRAPEHADVDADLSEQAVPMDGDDVLEEIDDAEDELGGNEAEGEGEVDGVSARGHGEGYNQSFGQQSMIFTAADPILWREETERVAKQLRMASSSNGVGLIGNVDSSWHSHFEVLKDFVKRNGVVEGVIDIGKTRSVSVPPMSGSIAELNTYMRQLDNELSGHCERINRFENTISLSAPLAALSSSYGLVKHELTELEGRVTVITRSLEEKSTSWAELQSEYDDVNDKYQEKYGGGIGSGDGASSSGGGSVLVRVKAAIHQIKEEVAQLSLREGVTSNALLEMRIAQQRAERRKKEAYYKNKRLGKKVRGSEVEESNE